jgi:hypothetical protein
MKETRKKNRWIRIMAFTFLFALLSFCVMSGTLAQYASRDTINDTGRVAKWGFAGFDKTPNVVKIFDTAYNGTVVSAGIDKVVAPGTGGAIDFKLADGTSEVDTRLVFKITETGTGNIPIIYQYGGAYYSRVVAAGDIYVKRHGDTAFAQITIAGDMDALAAALAAAAGTVEAGDNYNTFTGSISWFWAFEQSADGTTVNTVNDTADTVLGTAGTAEVTLSVIVEAVQID